MLLRVVATALAAGEELVGSQTRRAGNLVLVASALVALTSLGIVEASSVPPFGLPLTGAVTTLDVLLVLTVLAALLMYALRLLADVERLVRRELLAAASRLHAQAEAETRRIEEAERLAAFRSSRTRQAEEEGAVRRAALEARVRSLGVELDRLRDAGERGSRFTRFSSERAVAETELRGVLDALDELRAVEDGSGEGEAEETVPARVGLSRDYLERLALLDETRARLERSRLMAFSQRLRVTVDVCLAPAVGVAAVGLWILTL